MDGNKQHDVVVLYVRRVPDERIIGYALKVSQCPILVMNEKTYEYINIDKI